MNHDSLYVIIPAYNESDTITAVIDEWYKVVENTNNNNSRLVVINDGSKDNTLQILQKAATTRPQLTVLDKPNGGHGSTVLYGYEYALKHNADFIFQTDSDGQTLASEFSQLWNQRHNFDVQFGFRKKREDGAARWVVTKTLRMIIYSIFHTWVTDANTPYRLMRADVLREAIKYVPLNYNLPNVILSVYFIKFHFKYRFVRITFRPRQGGVNSINIKSISKIGTNALSDFYNIKKHIDRNEPYNEY